MNVRRCDRCGSEAIGTRDKKRLTLVCTNKRCKYKTVKNIVKKGRGG